MKGYLAVIIGFSILMGIMDTIAGVLGLQADKAKQNKTLSGTLFKTISDLRSNSSLPVLGGDRQLRRRPGPSLLFSFLVFLVTFVVLSSLVDSLVIPTFSPTADVGHDGSVTAGGVPRIDAGVVADLRQSSPEQKSVKSFIFEVSVVGSLFCKSHSVNLTLFSKPQLSGSDVTIVVTENPLVVTVPVSFLELHHTTSFPDLSCHIPYLVVTSPCSVSPVMSPAFLTEDNGTFTGSVGYNLVVDARALRKVDDNPLNALQGSSMVDVNSPPSDNPFSRRLPLTNYHRRRSPSSLIQFDGGVGIPHLNPNFHFAPLLGFIGPLLFNCCWVMVLGFMEFQMFKCFWVLKLIIGTSISLGVVIFILRIRTLLYHPYSLLLMFNLVNILTSLPFIRSWVRESLTSMPLFKRATFPGRNLSDQRLYSQVEKFQTACKRIIGFLKAALSWSPFEECDRITHLDPIEEFTSMRFEELSLCFMFCIVIRFMYYDYVTDVY